MKQLSSFVILFAVLIISILGVGVNTTQAQEDVPVWGIQINMDDFESTITHLESGNSWTLPLVVLSSPENNSTANAIVVGGPDEESNSWISYYIHIELEEALEGPNPLLSTYWWWNDSVIYHAQDEFGENHQVGILSNLEFHQGLIADLGDDPNTVVTLGTNETYPSVWVETSTHTGQVMWTPKTKPEADNRLHW